MTRQQDDLIERPSAVIDHDKLTFTFADEAIDEGLDLLDGTLGDVSPRARNVAYLVRLRTAGRFTREAKAAGDWMGCSWKDALTASVSYSASLAMFGCTTCAVETADGPVVARNLDWWPTQELSDATYLISHQRSGEDRWWTAGWPGFLGVVTGMSANGFSVILNAVGSSDRPSFFAYPVMLHLRRVLEDCETFDEAVESIQHTPLAAACLLTVVGSENHQRVVVERTPNRAALRWGEPGEPLIATNDYKLMDRTARPEGEIYDTACGRYQAAYRALSDPTASLSDEALLNVLSRPDVRMGITAQHVLMRPATQEMRVFVPA